MAEFPSQTNLLERRDMGLFRKISTATLPSNNAVMKSYLVDTKNPNPYKYKILKTEQLGEYLIVKINYPNCENYEGNKILVYKNTTIDKLVSGKYIDPHFFDNKIYNSPIARFRPTKEGWNMAINFVKGLK